MRLRGGRRKRLWLCTRSDSRMCFAMKKERRFARGRECIRSDLGCPLSRESGRTMEAMTRPANRLPPLPLSGPTANVTARVRPLGTDSQLDSVSSEARSDLGLRGHPSWPRLTRVHRQTCPPAATSELQVLNPLSQPPALGRSHSPSSAYLPPDPPPQISIPGSDCDQDSPGEKKRVPAMSAG